MNQPHEDGLGAPEGESRFSGKALDRLAEALVVFRALPAAGGDPATDEDTAFGRFRLRQVLGQGRFGIVFLAYDPAAGRPVALKVPQAGVLLDPALTDRFRRDVEAAGQLDHPGIVPVLETGSVHSVAYIVMPHIEGPTLAAWLAEHPRGVPTLQAVELAIAMTDAVQHAHERGVLHCDLKPANVLIQGSPASPRPDPQELIAERCDYIPKITDFGLARLLFRPAGETQTSLAAGTPPYMAPEQARGVRRHLTARCDVHALAAILYEVLTGRPPYVGTDADRLRQLLDPDTQPQPPGLIRRDVPRDLEAIVLRGLEKDPSRRYDSAKALADDLRRFREGRPTRARPVGLVGRATRWARRRPAVALLVAACLLVTIAATWLAARLGFQALLHQQALDQKDQVAKLLEFNALLESVRLRRQEQPEGWADANLIDVRRLAAMAPAEFQPTLCSETAVALIAPRLRLVRELGVGKNAYVCAFSPDGETLALGERYPVLKSDELRVWLVRTTGEDVGELRYKTDLVWERRQGHKRADGARSLAYSPDGRWLVIGTRGGRLVRWDLRETSPRPVAWPGHAGDGPDHRGDEVRSLLFNRDGTVLLSGSHGRYVRQWDPRDGWKQVDLFPALLSINNSPVGESAWLHRDLLPPWSSLQPFDLRTGLFAPKARAPHYYQFCQSRDGERLAAFTDAPFGINLSLACPEVPFTQGPLVDLDRTGRHGEVTDLALTPSGRWSWFSSQKNGKLHLSDAVQGKLVASERLLGGSARLAGHPGGRLVAVCEEGRTLLFEVEERPIYRALAEGGPLHSFALSPDGQRLATARHHVPAVPDNSLHYRAQVTVYDRANDGFTRRHHIRPTMSGNSQGLPVVMGSRSSGPSVAVQAACGNNLGIVALDHSWIPTGHLHDLQFDPAGRLWAANDRGELLVWSGVTKLRVASTVSPEAVRAGVNFQVIRTGPTGTLAGRRDGQVEWFDTEGRRLGAWDVFADQEVSSLAVNADGSEALVGGSEGSVVRLKLRSGKIDRPDQRPHTDAVAGLAYLDGGAILTASADHSIRLWDSGWNPLLVLREAGPIVRAEFSPGGELIVLVRGEWGLRIWDLAELADQLRELGLRPGFVVRKASRPPVPTPRGLIAELYFNRDFTDLLERRRDLQVNFDWDKGAASHLGQVDDFSVRWTGWLRAPKPGGWEFQLDCDDDGTLWLDGRVVFRQAGYQGTNWPTANLSLPDRPVSFRLDFVERGGHARCRLLWRPAGTTQLFVPVPPEAFTPD